MTLEEFKNSLRHINERQSMSNDIKGFFEKEEGDNTRLYRIGDLEKDFNDTDNVIRNYIDKDHVNTTVEHLYKYLTEQYNTCG